jgi:hypothetical protein
MQGDGGVGSRFGGSWFGARTPIWLGGRGGDEAVLGAVNRRRVCM